MVKAETRDGANAALQPHGVLIFLIFASGTCMAKLLIRSCLKYKLTPVQLLYQYLYWLKTLNYGNIQQKQPFFVKGDGLSLH